MVTENSIRQRVIDTAIAMSDSGLSPGRSGNVSARFETGFLITPSGLPYDALQLSDIVFIDENGIPAAKARIPSSEWRFHHDVYGRFEETGGIVHCHSRYATALACCNREIPAFHYMVAAAGGKKIPIAPYALFGTQALSDNVIAALEGYKASLMEHHGLIALGDTVEAALDLAHEVEDLAAQYVLVLTLGSPQLLSDEQMDEVVERFKTYGVQEPV
jgi:L-fuculose-phosphate aldolase